MNTRPVSDNMTSLGERVKQTILEVPDFPMNGVSFKDVTPLFLMPSLCREIVEELGYQYRQADIEAIIGLESRGFLLGMPLAMLLDVPFIMVRKKGKLPRETLSVSYSLEYGEATIEMHRDDLKKGQRVLIHDDVLATGGTAQAAATLVQKAGAEVAGFSFVIELAFLHGRKTIEQFSKDISTFAVY